MSLNGSWPEAPGLGAPFSESGRRFLTLDSLRIVSALAVVFMHLGGAGAKLFSHGYLAVDLFFVMSGAVIAHAYDGRLQSGMSLWGFMSARLKRLGPIYLVGAVLGAACSLAAHILGYGGDGAVLPNLILALLFVPAVFGGGELYPLNSPCWSLLAELCANVGYGATAKTLSLKKLLVFTALAAACLVSMGLRSPIGVNMGVNTENWLGGMVRVAFGFPMGVILFRLQRKARRRRWGIPTWLAMAFAAASFAAPWRSGLYDLSMILLVYPALVGLSMQELDQTKKSAKMLFLGGAISFPLYALHYPLSKLAGIFIAPQGMKSILEIGLCITILVVIAYAAMRFIDAPLRARMYRPPAPPLGQRVMG